MSRSRRVWQRAKTLHQTHLFISNLLHQIYIFILPTYCLFANGMNICLYGEYGFRDPTPDANIWEQKLHSTASRLLISPTGPQIGW